MIGRRPEAESHEGMKATRACGGIQALVLVGVPFGGAGTPKFGSLPAIP